MPQGGDDRSREALRAHIGFHQPGLDAAGNALGNEAGHQVDVDIHHIRMLGHEVLELEPIGDLEVCRQRTMQRRVFPVHQRQLEHPPVSLDEAHHRLDPAARRHGGGFLRP
jgi:hypothetical protein